MYDPEHTRLLPHFAAPSLNLHRFCAIVTWAELRRPTMVCVGDMSRQSRCLLLLYNVGCSSGESTNENNQRDPAYVCVCVCVRTLFVELVMGANSIGVQWPARSCACAVRVRVPCVSCVVLVRVCEPCVCASVLACTFYLHVTHIVESDLPSPPRSVIKYRQSEMHQEERRVKKRHMK
jgi:hypothetical protein